MEKPARTKAIGVRFDPKTHYLAELASHRLGCKLSSFIEWAVKQALTDEAMEANEPTPGKKADLKAPSRLWMDALWDEDESDRLYLLSAHTELMNSDQRVLFNLLSDRLIRDHKSRRFTRQQFRELWEEVVAPSRRADGAETR